MHGQQTGVNNNEQIGMIAELVIEHAFDAEFAGVDDLGGGVVFVDGYEK